MGLAGAVPVFGLLLGPAAFYIRTRLNEPDEFILVRAHAEMPLREAASSDKARILVGAGLVAAGACGSYLNTYMPTFAFTRLGLPASTALLGTVAAGLGEHHSATRFSAICRTGSGGRR